MSTSDGKKSVDERVEFLNIDLELTSPVELCSLGAALQPMLILHGTDSPPFETKLEIRAEFGF